MGDLLAEMAAASAERVAEARRAAPDADVRARAEARAPAPPLSLGGFDLIAEVKRRAPSAGRLVESVDPVAQARSYAAGGAAAISVLTEPHRFDGSLADLEAVAAALDVPAMRKDFLVDPYQVFEARACGAGGVLLIVRMLDDGRMREMLDVADALGMWVLLEAFGGDDLTRATSQVDGRANVLVGLNSRNLRTLEVDIDRFEQLAGAFPAGVPRVAESGLVSPGDAARVAEAGYGLALVGTALMRSGAPQEAARAMIAAGRAVVS